MYTPPTLSEERCYKDMKKGVQIKKIRLSEYSTVELFDVNDNCIKTTRKQRNLIRDLVSYKQFHVMRESLVKEFSNPHILCDEFSIAICHESYDESVIYWITTNDMGTDVKMTSVDK